MATRSEQIRASQQQRVAQLQDLEGLAIFRYSDPEDSDGKLSSIARIQATIEAVQKWKEEGGEDLRRLNDAMRSFHLPQLNARLLTLEKDSSAWHTYTNEIREIGEIFSDITTSADQKIERLERLITDHIDAIKDYKGLQKAFEVEQALLLKTSGKKLALKELGEVFFNRKIYKGAGEGERDIDPAVKRMVYFYDVDGEQGQQALTESPFTVHQAALDHLGWDEERQVNLMNVLSAEGQSILTDRVQRLHGFYAAGYNVQADIKTTNVPPGGALVKNKEGDYEIYIFNLSRIAKEGHTVEDGYDVAVMRLVLDGNAIDNEKKPFKDAIKAVNISPPLYFDKRELEKQLGLQTAKSPDESALKTPRHPQMVQHMVQTMIASIPDEPFREGTRKVVTSYNENIH